MIKVPANPVYSGCPVPGLQTAIFLLSSLIVEREGVHTGAYFKGASSTYESSVNQLQNDALYETIILGVRTLKLCEIFVYI